jgi:GntR family transcriptional regulator
MLRRMTITSQVADDLRKAILAGEYPAGCAIPSGVKLAAIYGCSRVTVGAATDQLKREGLLWGEPGSGIFVAKPKIKWDLVSLGSTVKRLEANANGPCGAFKQHEEAMGLHPRQDVAVEETTADGETAGFLRLRAGEPVIVRHRLWWVDDEPLMVASSTYPGDVASGTKLSRPAAMPEGGDQVLADLGHPPTRYEDTLSWSPAAPDEITKLRIAESIPVVRLVRVSLDPGDLPIEMFVFVLPGDRCELHYDISA